MRNIQNRTVPVGQLVQFQTVQFQIVHQTLVRQWRSQYLTIFPCASVHSGRTGNKGAWQNTASTSELQWKLQQMSDIRPITLHNPALHSNDSKIL
jgi:hypothetical protein